MPGPEIRTGGKRDGEGRPYITLAQFLKAAELVPTGGQAKHRVRAGGIQVNGVPEDRPGRKLHQGDTVTVGDEEFTIEMGGAADGG